MVKELLKFLKPIIASFTDPALQATFRSAPFPFRFVTGVITELLGSLSAWIDSASTVCLQSGDTLSSTASPALLQPLLLHFCDLWAVTSHVPLRAILSNPSLCNHSTTPSGNLCVQPLSWTLWQSKICNLTSDRLRAASSLAVVGCLSTQRYGWAPSTFLP